MEIDFKKYLAEILRLMPLGSKWYITSSFDEFEDIILSLNPKKEDVGFSVILNAENKSSIKSLIENHHIEDKIERHTIKDCSGDLFRAYDNLEYAIISKRIELPDDLNYLIQEEYLSIATDW